MNHDPVIFHTTLGVVELDPASVIGLREVQLNQTNQLTGVTTQVPGVEILTLGGYSGIAVVGTRDEVRAKLRRERGGGLVVPRLGVQ